MADNFNKNFIHLVSNKDIYFYKKLCYSDSVRFGNSEAFPESYLPRRPHPACYNDGESIFFFGNSSSLSNFYLCCPKGKNIYSKIIEFISYAKNKYKFKKIWLFEISKPIHLYDFRRIGIKKAQQIEMKRPVIILKKFENFISLWSGSRHKKLRQKWNQFFNFLRKKEGRAELSAKRLTSINYDDARKIINLWYEQIKNKKNESFLSPEIIFKKNITVINNAASRPQLYECFIFYCNNMPRGIRAAFRIENSLNLGGSLLCADRVVPQSAFVFNLIFFQLMARRGYNLINLGNSYSRSVDFFKHQFQPSKYDISYEYHLSF